MKKHISPNALIVTEPYKPTGVTTSLQGGLARIDQKTALFPLKVLQACTLHAPGLYLELAAGDVVYVKQSSLETNQNYKNPLKLNGLDIILVELKDVVLVEKEAEAQVEEKIPKSRRPARDSNQSA